MPFLAVIGILQWLTVTLVGSFILKYQRHFLPFLPHLKNRWLSMKDGNGSDSSDCIHRVQCDIKPLMIPFNLTVFTLNSKYLVPCLSWAPWQVFEWLPWTRYRQTHTQFHMNAESCSQRRFLKHLRSACFREDFLENMPSESILEGRLGKRNGM